jgi:hypothetical protein
MKNLKKVLALVLVIAMVMGFAVSASAAEFSDADLVAEQNQTAVDVLTALNIIEGFEDGSFKPEASVTRAQVAKMIAVAFNEGDESINELYRNAPTTLTDISGTWAEGYIKYMANVGYISGFPDGTYRPDAAVTPNQLCQIMLNILGYDIDTTVSWATAVQAKSFSVGLLKNVSTAVGSECPRQEAAQIIYNALNMEILEANTLGVKVGSGETILTKYLGAAKRNVVVTDNEEASLNSDSVQEAGITLVNNESAKLNWSTTMDMIGQSYTIWTKGNTVVYFEEGANTVQEYTAEAEVTAKNAGMKIAGAAEFINFADDVQDVYTTDIRITYWYDENGNGTEDANEIHTIAAETDLTDAQVADLHTIFKQASLTTIGYVAVGTKNVSATDDISNDISWSKFVKDYLKVNANNAINAKSNQNGNYIKVIDNDGDGEAEYILQTKYVLDQITDVTTKGPDTVYTLTKTEYSEAKQAYVNVTVSAENIVTDDELANGDVILYALIDGVYYVDVVTPVTETVSSINYKTNTITCASENTYTQSGITNDTDMLEAVASMEKNASYNLYLDKYDYVRAYIEASYGDYVLLTEMYRDTTDRNNLIQDGNYTVETVAADGNIANYAVANVAGIRTFYSGTTDYNLLKGNGLNKAVTGSWTNVADSAIDGETISLASVAKTYRYVSGNINTTIQPLTDEVVTAGEITKGQRRFYFDKNGVTDYVSINADTIVYLVYGSSEIGLTKVEVGTGYTAIPAIANTSETINSVYAVATDTRYDSTGATYPVADVLVIEIKSNYTKDFVLGYQDYTETVDSILSDGTTGDVALATGATFNGVGFYELINGELTNSALTYSNYITSGVLHEKNKLLDYVNFYAWSNGVLAEGAKNVTTLDYDETLPVYTITAAPGSQKLTAQAGTVADLVADDNIIVVWKDARHSAPAYIVNVTDSVAALTTVYNNFKGTIDTSFTTAKAAADAALATPTLSALTDAQETLDAVDVTTLSSKDAQTLGELKAKVAAALKPLQAAADLADAEAALIDAYTTEKTASGAALADAKTALIEKAAAYKAANNNTAPASGDAKKAYDEAVTLANAIASDVNTALTSLANIKTASDAAEKYTSDVAAVATTAVAAGTTDKITAAKANYDAAKALVEAYDKYVKTQTAADKQAAIDALPSTTVNSAITALSDSNSDGVVGTEDYDAAYAAVLALKPAEDADGAATFALKKNVVATLDLEHAGTAADPYVVTVPKGAATAIGNLVQATVTVGSANPASFQADKATGLKTYTVDGTGNGKTTTYYFSVVNSTAEKTTAISTVFGNSTANSNATTYTVTVGKNDSELTAADIVAADNGTVRLVNDAEGTATVQKVQLAANPTETVVYVEVTAADGISVSVITLTVTRNA